MNRLPGNCATVFYKYKDLSKNLSGIGLEQFEDLMRNNRIWFSSPMHFNDPFDCRCMFDTRNSREQVVLRKAEYFTKSGMSINEAIAKADSDIPKDSDDLQKWQESQIQGHARRAANSAILCLTENYDNPIMWTHYAKWHTGICIVFRIQDQPDQSQVDFIAEAQPIEYSDRCPLINFVQDRSPEIARKALLTKSTPYFYESEWRIVRYDDGPGLKNIPEGIVGGVILGVNILSEDRERVIKACAGYDGDVDIVQAHLDPHKYGLKLIRELTV
jgi:hypothetical protein